MSAPLFFPAEKRTLVTHQRNGDPLHDHSPSPYLNDDYIVECEHAECHHQLIAQGGIELVKRTWFVARDVHSFNIPQGRDGSHLHEPHGKAWSVACDSPWCTSFFEGEWQRSKLGGGRPVAAPTEADRPKTLVELEEEERDFRERIRLQAETEVAVRERMLGLSSLVQARR